MKITKKALRLKPGQLTADRSFYRSAVTGRLLYNRRKHDCEGCALNGNVASRYIIGGHNSECGHSATDKHLRLEGDKYYCSGRGESWAPAVTTLPCGLEITEEEYAHDAE